MYLLDDIWINDKVDEHASVVRNCEYLIDEVGI
jgi:hypothetical protein